MVLMDRAALSAAHPFLIRGLLTRPRPRTLLPARHGLRLESLESRAMLSSMPFIATLPDDLASRTASLFTVQGRYGNNALNGDWELGITSNTSAAAPTRRCFPGR